MDNAAGKADKFTGKGKHSKSKGKGKRQKGRTEGEQNKGATKGKDVPNKGKGKGKSAKLGRHDSEGNHSKDKYKGKNCITQGKGVAGHAGGKSQGGKQSSQESKGRERVQVDNYTRHMTGDEVGHVKILCNRYGCHTGEIMAVSGDSRDGQSWLIPGGRTVPKFHEGSGWDWFNPSAKYAEAEQDVPSRIWILLNRYGCQEGRILRVEGESRDGQNWLVQGGHQVPKSQEGFGWEAADSDDEESNDGYHAESSVDRGTESDSCSSNQLYNQQYSSTRGHQQRAANDFGDDDWYNDSHLDRLRDEHPNLDSDDLQELYEQEVLADAEEFCGYQCDSD